MTLFILTETAAGYALLKARDKKLLARDDLISETATVEGVCGLVKLKEFRKFDSASSALEEAAAVGEGKVTPMLGNLLAELKAEKKVSLAVADVKLGNAITKLPGLQISPVSDSRTAELYRAIREHLPSLIPGLLPDELNSMSLGLSHSLSRHKLKFSPDKIDTMIIQAIALLDDLDKELNTYAMRVKEWYGWHFPEMARIINDNWAYARVILAVGMRSNCATADLSSILPQEIEGAVRAAAEVSMGTEITDEDLTNIQALAEQVVSFTDYRQQLSSYLSVRMQAIAPNLTALVGELVGARLIAHAGSLMNLAKSPASTIQILGAEKALFRALKTKHDTPKYGLIYHASLIGQASGKNKGKIARMLATKATLGLRVDALSDWGTAGEGSGAEPTEVEKAAVGINSRVLLEKRLRALEGKPLKPVGVAIGPQGQKAQQNQPGKWEIREARKYNPDADGISADAKPAANEMEPASKKRKLVEEIGQNKAMKRSQADAATKSKPVENEVADEEDEEDEEEDEEEGVDPEDGDGKLIERTGMNGTATQHKVDPAAPKEVKSHKSKKDKAARREEKRKMKLEKAMRKAERAARKVKKQAPEVDAKDGATKPMSNGVGDGHVAEKKRKPQEDGESEQRRKKKAKV